MDPNDKVPITYLPPDTIRNFNANKSAVAKKGYQKYFNEQLYIRRNILDMLRAPVDEYISIEKVSDSFKRMKSGWSCLKDGTAYVSSRTTFDKCNPDMIKWWFWWHSQESERYMLWYPYNHFSVQSTYHQKLDLNIPHEEKYVGSVHTIGEYIGPSFERIKIHFKNLEYYGIASDHIVASACGEVWQALIPLKLGDMIHLWYYDEDKVLQLQSIYYLGNKVKLSVLGVDVGVDYLGGLLGIKNRMAGEKLAYEQFLHDQIEFTNLNDILPKLYNDFGPKN